MSLVLRLPTGHLDARITEKASGISRITLYSPLVTVVTSTADFELMVGADNGWLSVRRGTVRVRTQSGLELTLGSGQNLVLMSNQQSVWAQVRPSCDVCPIR